MQNFNKYYAVRSVTFDVTNQCNLRCDYCFEKDKNPETMAVEDALRMAKEIDANFRERTYKTQPGKSLMVCFFGGEPTLNMPVIRAVVDFFNSQEYFVEFTMTTNLTLVTDADIAFFKENDFGLLVSLDGTKETHDKHRCNSYDRVVANLKKLLAAGLGFNTQVRLTLPPDAVGTMAQGVKEVFAMGVDNIVPMIVYDQPWTDAQWGTFEEQIREVFDFAMDVYNDESNKRNLSIKAFDEYIEDCLTKTNINEVPCGMGNDVFISLAPNGNVAPCHQVPTDFAHQELVMGNILTDEFDEKRILSVREQRSYSNRCQGCEHRAICSGGCPIENYRATGVFNRASDTWCRYISIMTRVIKDYQRCIFQAKNIRNRKLTIIQENLKLEKLLHELRSMDIYDPLTLVKLADVQEFVFNHDKTLMPAFKEMAELVIGEVVGRAKKETEEIDRKADNEWQTKKN